MIADKCYTLNNSTEEYLAMRGVEIKKYFPMYLICAKNAFKDIFKNTMWITQNTWLPLKKGEPYNYIEVPAGTNRIFTVNEVDHCGNLVPLYYNNKLNIIKKPTKKACGCDACDCSGLCEDVNAMQLVTKEVFTIGNTTYYEKIWYKFCPNGDILEYSELPTKKYNDMVGQSGDYNDDSNNDYSIGNPGLANFEIVTVTSQRKICTLTTLPCGCPEETEENIQLAQQVCGCAWPTGVVHKKRCDHFLSEINNDCRGAVKLSECGTKIYYRPQPHHRKNNGTTKLPDWLNLSFQTNGIDPDGDTVVPDFSLNCLWAGIDYYSKRFNMKWPLHERNASKYAFNDECNKLILYLNPISLESLSQIQDVPIRW